MLVLFTPVPDRLLNNLASAFYTSSVQLVVKLFWSDKIVYGIFLRYAYYPPPNHDQKFKPLICFEWIIANAIVMLLAIAITGSNESVRIRRPPNDDQFL